MVLHELAIPFPSYLQFQGFEGFHVGPPVPSADITYP
jgi:hypothetical protein